jgi:hypothetical protein
MIFEGMERCRLLFILKAACQEVLRPSLANIVIRAITSGGLLLIGCPTNVGLDIFQNDHVLYLIPVKRQNDNKFSDRSNCLLFDIH